MRTSDLIKNETQTVKWIKDEFENDNLFVDNGFQRRYVWLKKHQIRLIETVLMGYVIPEIYIWEVGTNADTGETKYSIVDGQQRIGAIVSYINGEFPLTRAYLSNQNATYAGKKFSELDAEDKKNIWGYSLSLRKILDSVGKEDIINIFLRLNSTDKSLNPQELRNAEYDGLFLKTAIDIANLDFWKKYNVFSSDMLRRMGDVEFVSSILIFFRRGIESEISQDAINEAYDLYNEQYDEAEVDKGLFDRILKNVALIAERDTSKTMLEFIKRKTHLYTIIVAAYKYVKEGSNMSDQQMDNIISFYKKYEYSKASIAEEYRTLFQEGTRSKQNRLRRVKILCEVIEGKVVIAD